MKLKYYVRGLGIGIVFATILCIISMAFQKPAEMTDAEIISRAEALGMIMPDYKENEVESLSEDSSETESETETESESESEQETESIAENETTTESEAASTEPVQAASEAQSSETEPLTQAPVASEPVTETPTTAATAVVQIISVDIVSGMSSDAVARLLMQAGIVDNAGEFDMFMVNNGYANYIQTGHYEIDSNLSYDAIARIITGR